MSSLFWFARQVLCDATTHEIRVVVVLYLEFSYFLSATKLTRPRFLTPVMYIASAGHNRQLLELCDHRRLTLPGAALCTMLRAAGGACLLPKINRRTSHETPCSLFLLVFIV